LPGAEKQGGAKSDVKAIAKMIRTDEPA